MHPPWREGIAHNCLEDKERGGGKENILLDVIWNMMKEVCSHLRVFKNKEYGWHVYILLKGECLLSLNKALSSPPTAVLFINTTLAGMRIVPAQIPSQPWAQPWIDLLCWQDERRGFPPVTLQMNLLEASCGRKSIYRHLTHSSCCWKLPTAFEATLTSLLPQPPCSKQELEKQKFIPRVQRFSGFSLFYIRLLTWRLSTETHPLLYYLFNTCAKGRMHK